MAIYTQSPIILEYIEQIHTVVPEHLVKFKEQLFK